MRLLEATVVHVVVFVIVVDVVVVIVVAIAADVIVVGVVIIVVNFVVVSLLDVAHADNIQLWSITVHLMLLKADVEFVWLDG